MALKTPKLVWDDTDNAIYYYNNWEVIPNSAAFNGSTHTTTDFNASVNITFNGSFITVFGTNAGDASYVIDNETISTSSSFTLNSNPANQVLFQPPRCLADGSHTLVITNDFGSLSLDYITVVPSATDQGSTPPPTSGLIQFDDASPYITYIGTSMPLNNTDPRDYHQTLHNISSLGSTASLNFHGTFVAVYGALPPSYTGLFPNLTFILDGSSQTLSSDPGDPGAFPLPMSSNNMVHQALIWKSPELPGGQHDLVIMLEDDGPFLLDFVLVEVPQRSPSLSPSPPLPTLTGSSALPTVGAMTTQASPKTDIASIIGGVLGGVSFFLVLFVIYLLKRRHASPNRSKNRSSVLSLHIPDEPRPPARTVFSGIRTVGRGATRYYVDGSGRPVRTYNGTASESDPTAPPLYYSDGRRARVHENRPDDGTLEREGIERTALAAQHPLYGHDEKFAMFGQSS